MRGSQEVPGSHRRERLVSRTAKVNGAKGLRRFKPHLAYKDSGVEWLGDIPVDWTVAKFSWFYRLGMGETLIREDLLPEGKTPVFSATEGNDVLGYLDRQPRTLLQKDDLVITARGTIGSVRIVQVPCTSTQTTIWCKPLDSEALLPRFVYWYTTGSGRTCFPRTRRRFRS